MRRFPYHDAASWTNSIHTGAVKLNAQKTTPMHLLENMDVVSYERPRSQEPVVDTNINLLYQDDQILVVEKNSNLPIAESGKYYRNTLINILKEQEEYRELYAVHRLDKETSGVLLIARSKTVAAQLSKQFAAQIPKKTYHAILSGELPDPEILVDQPIKRCTPEQSQIKIKQVIDPEGKPSRTLFQSLKSGKGLTLAKIRIFSGRTHQIRCHAAFIGHPIIGDKLYGQSDNDFLDYVKAIRLPEFSPYGTFDRQLLHASVLEFVHPETHKEMRFDSDFYREFSKFPTIKAWLDVDCAPETAPF